MFIAILLSLSIVEITIRIFLPEKAVIQKPPSQWVNIPEQVWTEPHPTLGWYHQKSKTALLKKNNMEIPIHINSSGFRGRREYEEKKPPQTIRLLILGDSFAFGWGGLDNETFSAQLEERIKTIEAINLGVSGYGIDQIALSFHEIGKKFNPDYVVITIFPEDFWRATRAFTDAGYGKPYFKLSSGNILTLKNVPVHSLEEMKFQQFPEIIEYHRFERLLLHTATYRFLKKKTLRLARDLDFVDPDLTEEWQLGQAILRQLVKEIQITGAQPLLMIIPPAQWMENTKPTSIQKSLVRFANREQVGIIDPTSALIEVCHQYGVDKFYIKDDSHWTSEGHSIIANLLVQYLKTQGQKLETTR